MEELKNLNTEQLLKLADRRALAELLRIADEHPHQTHPPTVFMIHIVEWGCSYRLAEKGWELFKKVRRPITMQEIREYASK